MISIVLWLAIAAVFSASVNFARKQNADKEPVDPTGRW